MTDFLEHLANNIKKIISEEDKLSSAENFESTMVDVKTFKFLDQEEFMD